MSTTCRITFSVSEEDAARLEKRVIERQITRPAFARQILLAELDHLDEAEKRKSERHERDEERRAGVASIPRIPHGFSLRSGRRVKWATATIADIEERIADLDAVHSGAVAFHRRIIQAMVKHKVGVFGELADAERRALLAA